MITTKMEAKLRTFSISWLADREVKGRQKKLY